MALDLNDKTANGNNLTNVNTVAEYTTTLPFTTNGNVRAASFTAASSQYFYAEDSASLSITGDMTIELWVNFSSLPSSNTIMRYVGKDNGTVYCYYFGQFNDAGTEKMVFQVSNNGTFHSQATVAWTPSTGTWYHVAVVYTAAGGTADFYVNGSQQGTQQSGLDTSIVNNALRLGIGARGVTPDTPDQFFNGVMDDIRIYNSARSAASIAADYQQDLLDVTGLAAYWPFETPTAAVSTNKNYSFFM